MIPTAVLPTLIKVTKISPINGNYKNPHLAVSQMFQQSQETNIRLCSYALKF